MLFEGIIILFSYAPLAQLVEQLTLNQMVGGSNPLWRTKVSKRGFLYHVFLFFIKSNTIEF